MKPNAIQIQEVVPGIVFATRLDRVVIGRRDGDRVIPLLSFKEVSVDPSLIDWVRGKMFVSLTAEGQSGTMDVVVSQAGERMEINLLLDGIGLESVPYLKEKLHLNMAGKFYGKVTLFWDSANINRSDGDIDIELRELVVQPSKVKAADGLELDLPRVQLSGKDNSFFRATLQKGRLQLKQFDLLGEELEFSLNGRVPISKKIELSRLYLKGSFQIADELAKNLPFLFMIEKQKTPEGEYPLAISGTLQKPQIRIGKVNLPI